MPGTTEISQTLLNAPIGRLHLPRFNAYVSEMEVLSRALKGYYTDVNFELILHAAETLYTLNLAVPGYVDADIYKPAYSAFVDISPRWRELIESETTLDFLRGCVEVLIRFIWDSANSVSHATLGKLGGFIDRLRERFEPAWFTLNYDDLVERVSTDWFDGFVQRADQFEFSEHDFMANYESSQVLCHLHGCTNFDMGEIGRVYKIIKYGNDRDPRVTPKTLAFRLQLQSGETSILGPIISGLRKADKVAFPPFGYYNHALVHYLCTHPRLLVLGYGAKDPYINEWLMQFEQCHGKNAKAVIITSVGKDDDSARHDLQVLNYLLGNELTQAKVSAIRPGAGPTQIGNVLIFTDGALRSSDQEAALMRFLA